MSRIPSLRRVLDGAERRPVLTVGCIAVAARLALAVGSFIATDGVLIPDERQYVDLARTVADGGTAEDWFAGYGQSLYDHVWVFLAPLRVLFDVFGSSRFVGQLWSASWGVTAAVLVVVLTARVGSRRAALGAGLVVALLPSQILWSSVVLRESMVWAGLMGAAVGAALVIAGDARRRQPVGLLVTAGCLLVLGLLRDQTMLAATWSLPVAVVLGARNRRVARLAPSLLVALVVPWLSGTGPAGYTLLAAELPALPGTRADLAVGADSGFGATTVPPATSVPPASPVTLPTTSSTAPPIELDDGDTLVETPDGRTHRVNRDYDYYVAPSGVLYVFPSESESNLRSIPTGAVAVLFRPFPWDASASLPLRLASVENAFWYVLYLLAAVGVVLGWRRHRDVVAYPAVASSVVLAVAFVTQGNLGTSFRHRGQVLAPLAVLAAVGVHLWLERRRSREAVNG